MLKQDNCIAKIDYHILKNYIKCIYFNLILIKDKL